MVRTTLAITVVAAAAIMAAPASAQLSNSVGGGASGGVGASSSAGGGSTPGDSGGAMGGAAIGGTGGAAGGGAATTEQRATEGSGTINPLNADAIARSGNPGSASSFVGTSSGTSGTVTGVDNYQSTAGAGPDRLYNIPRAPIAVDPAAIRGALEAGPSATPKADGS
jgi:hypothetical protein